MNDNISRRAVMDFVGSMNMCDQISDDAYKDLICYLEDLPPAQPDLAQLLAYECGKASAQPEQRWIPCSEMMPERIIHEAIETEQEFFVTVKERWPGEEWRYHTDIAFIPGDYIDEFWQTYNDWYEGQEVHVIAWMPLPEPYAERRTDEAD